MNTSSRHLYVSTFNTATVVTCLELTIEIRGYHPPMCLMQPKYMFRNIRSILPYDEKVTSYQKTLSVNVVSTWQQTFS
jgi:hypothetical protein